MLHFSGTKKDAVEFADALLNSFGSASLSITIIRPARYEAYSVSIVIDTLLEDIVKIMAVSYCMQRIDISYLTILDG